MRKRFSLREVDRSKFPSTGRNDAKPAATGRKGRASYVQRQGILAELAPVPHLPGFGLQSAQRGCTGARPADGDQVAVGAVGEFADRLGVFGQLEAIVAG